jgi:hypothetical protein
MLSRGAKWISPQQSAATGISPSLYGKTAGGVNNLAKINSVEGMRTEAPDELAAVMISLQNPSAFVRFHQRKRHGRLLVATAVTGGIIRVKMTR